MTAIAAESLLSLLLAVGLGFAPALEVLALAVGAAEGSGHLSHAKSIGIQDQHLKDHYLDWERRKRRILLGDLLAEVLLFLLFVVALCVFTLGMTWVLTLTE